MEYVVADRIQLGEVDNTENEPDQALNPQESLSTVFLEIGTTKIMIR